MDRFKLPALDTLQDRLSGNAEDADGLAHRHVPRGSHIDKARTQILGDTDTPGSSGCDLVPGDEAVVEAAMEGRGRDFEDLGGLLDADQLSSRRFRWSLEARVPQ